MNEPYYRLTKKTDQALDVVVGDGLQPLNPDGSPTVFIADAVVTVTILTPAGATITGGGPLSAAYQGSNGRYRALVDETFDPPVGPAYRIKIVVTTPGGGNGTWYGTATVMDGLVKPA